MNTSQCSKGDWLGLISKVLNLIEFNMSEKKEQNYNGIIFIIIKG